MPSTSASSKPANAASTVELEAISSSRLCAGATAGAGMVVVEAGDSSSSASARWR